MEAWSSDIEGGLVADKTSESIGLRGFLGVLARGIASGAQDGWGNQMVYRG